MSAALAAAVLLLAIVAGSAAASGSNGALRDPYVAPRSGTPTTVIQFAVTFQGHDEHSVAQVTVLIDGVAREMWLARDVVAHGNRYRFSTTLPIGTHLIRFHGTDGSANAYLDAGQVEIVGDSGTGSGGTGPGIQPGTSASPPTPAPPAPTATPAPTAVPPAAPVASPTPGATGGPSDAGSSPGSSTGGAQATSHDAPGAADQTSGPGGGPASGGSPAGAPPTARREYDSAGAIDSSPTLMPDGLALGLAGGPDAGGGGSGGPGGRLDDRALSLLAGDGSGISPETRMLVAAISTTTTATAVMAFFMFGKRRRDGEPPAPDEVLAANAARFGTTPASLLVPADGPGSGGRLADEAGIPRWRRPSLLEARKADPRYSATATHGHQSFNHGGDPATAGTERRKIRYRAVSLLDAPDPLRSAEIGDLDEGDEVQLLQKSGGYWLVLCPDGSQGWVHRMTLGDVVEYEGGAGAFNAARRSFAPRAGDAEPVEPGDATTDGGVTPDGNVTADGDVTAFAAADRSIAEDGTDLLSAYIRSRHAS